MDDQEIFTESHAKSILSTMNMLRKDGTLCDVTLKVQGQSFLAHRIVLAACSDYFCAMFTNEASVCFCQKQIFIEMNTVCVLILAVY